MRTSNVYLVLSKRPKKFKMQRNFFYIFKIALERELETESQTSKAQGEMLCRLITAPSFNDRILELESTSSAPAFQRWGNCALSNYPALSGRTGTRKEIWICSGYCHLVLFTSALVFDYLFIYFIIWPCILTNYNVYNVFFSIRM